MPKKNPPQKRSLNTMYQRTEQEDNYYKVILPAIFIALIIAYIILVIFHTKLS